ncbi:MAG: biopolymer transporter ExbD [Pirellula sp.]|nr:biopolymer transporter ExbD [Pirellula sp.]
MRIPSYRGTSRVSINMTPMIDVTFLLIIFFLVSSHLAKQENFLKLSLPQASSGQSDDAAKSTFTIQVLGDGSYQVGNQPMALDPIRRMIAQRNQSENGLVRIRIRTDRSSRYESIAGLLRICALTGNSDIVFAVYDEDSR